MLRLVHVPEAGWVPDERRRLAGPTLDVHCTAACVAGLADVPHEPAIEPRALREMLCRWLEEAVLDALSRVAAAGQIVAGHDVLREALGSGRIAHLLFSRDAAPRTRRSLEHAAPEGVSIHTLEADNEALGARVGHRPLAAVGLHASHASAPLRRRLEMRSALLS